MGCRRSDGRPRFFARMFSRGCFCSAHSDSRFIPVSLGDNVAMPRWVSASLLIAIPCFLALLAYDWVAVVVLGHAC